MKNEDANFPSIKLKESAWSTKIINGVFMQWCLNLATDNLKVTQWGSHPNNGFRFGDQSGQHFAIDRTDLQTWKIAKIAGFNDGQIENLVREAAQRTNNMDTGTDIAYQTELVSPSPSLDAAFGLNIARILGEQIPISGPRRLSRFALLDFTEIPSSVPDPLFSPEIKITTTVFVPGPAPGDLANNTAAAMIEIVAAICAFALGRPVNAPAVTFHMDADESEEVFSRREDWEIPGLARNFVSLDIFGELSTLGDIEAVTRAGNAFVTLHHAQRQGSADIATMLYVCAIEALIVPLPERSWAKDRVVARFRDGLLALCADKVDEILDHPNLGLAFDYRKRGSIRRQRKELAQRAYELRSVPTHTGIGPTGAFMGFAHNDFSMRAALLSDLARAAVLGYLQAPRSFLTGMPGIDPAVESDN